MFGKSKLSNAGSIGSVSRKAPIIFDIRVASGFQNVTLIYGSSIDTDLEVLKGDVVFSLPESLHVKRISLRLVGKFKLEFLQVGQHKNNNLASIVKEEQTIFEANWNNLLVDREGVISSGNSASKPILSRVRSVPMMGTTKKKLSRVSSPSVLELPSNGVSGTPFAGQQLPSGTSFMLPSGNYELPFEVTLPQDIAETVEGLQSGSVLYTMECCIERQGFNKTSFTKFEYLRIFRTLKSDDFAIQEEVYVGKSWPNKLQYEISIPSRAIPIGGATPINVKLYPFQKGYKLKRIHASLVQYYAFKDSSGEIYDDESVLQKQMLTKFDDVSGCDAERDNLLVSEVKINSVIQFPDDLKRVTQDCDVGDNLIKVRHRLQVVINLRRDMQNDQGETYERSTDIKVNLPIKLYITQHVPIQGRLVLLDHFGKIHFRSGELSPLFARREADTVTGVYTNSNSAALINSGSTANPRINRLTDGSYSVRYFPETDTQAPPTYSQHYNDPAMNSTDPQVIEKIRTLQITQSLPASPFESNLDSSSYFDYLPNQPQQHPLSPQPQLYHRPLSLNEPASTEGRNSMGIDTAITNTNHNTSSTLKLLNRRLQMLPSYDESLRQYDFTSREPTPLYNATPSGQSPTSTR